MAEQALRLNDVVVPRCLFPDKSRIAETEMHTFCNAPEEAYAAVIYVRNIYTDGSRLARTVQQAVRSSIHRCYFWIYSSTVRNWIRATADYYKVYVSNRIGEIQTITGSEEWRFIPRKYNSANAATRSALDGEPLPDIRWTDPESLKQSEELWLKDLPWMVIIQEIRPGRMDLTRAKQRDLQLSVDDIPAL